MQKFANHKEVGKVAEILASEYCVKKGYTIIENNFRNRYGEIDIIAKSPEGILVFIEVKSSRRHNSFPAVNVTPKKIKQIYNTAKVWCAKQKIENYEMRFDVISIIFKSKSTENEIEHIENAFWANSWF